MSSSRSFFFVGLWHIFAFEIGAWPPALPADPRRRKVKESVNERALQILGRVEVCFSGGIKKKKQQINWKKLRGKKETNETNKGVKRRGGIKRLNAAWFLNRPYRCQAVTVI